MLGRAVGAGDGGAPAGPDAIATVASTGPSAASGGAAAGARSNELGGPTDLGPRDCAAAHEEGGESVIGSSPMASRSAFQNSRPSRSEPRR